MARALWATARNTWLLAYSPSVLCMLLPFGPQPAFFSFSLFFSFPFPLPFPCAPLLLLGTSDNQGRGLATTSKEKGSCCGTHLIPVTPLASACGRRHAATGLAWLDGSTTSLSVPVPCVSPPSHMLSPIHTHSLSSTYTLSLASSHPSALAPAGRLSPWCSTLLPAMQGQSPKSKQVPCAVAYAIKAPRVSRSRLKAASAPGFAARLECVGKGPHVADLDDATPARSMAPTGRRLDGSSEAPCSRHGAIA